MKPNQIILLLFIVTHFSCKPQLSHISGTTDNWAESTLKNLSLREKIAQMMIYRMNLQLKDISKEKWKDILDLIEKDGIGGIHFWYGEASSSLIFLNEMQKKSKIPILIDADIEYGLNQRFKEGTELMPFMAIAATNKPNNAYEIGKIVAKESRALGVHWNFSPVVDVNNNPLNPIINVRSFSEDPDIVSQYGAEYVRGLQEFGMLATAKHFPGHGDTETDSHSSLAMIPSDSSRLWSIELPPFNEMIKVGVDAIMVAHVHAPDFQPDSDTPASMSKFWVNDILKKRLKFKGAIVTDGMGMGGITKNYSDSYALLEVINAGCDIIIQNHNLTQSINTIENAVLNGLISEKSIDESALKMLKMKEKIGLNYKKSINLTQIHNNVGNRENSIKAQRIASEAITCVKLEKDLLPISKFSKDPIFVFDIYDYQYNHSISKITKGLIKSGLNIKPYQVDESDSKVIIDAVIEDIPIDARVLINTFVTHKAWKDKISLPENEVYLIERLLEKTKNIILGSLGNPYIIQSFPEIPVYICAYKDNSLMQDAYMNAVLGKAPISGILPISIPGVSDIGHGVFIEKYKLSHNEKKYYSGIEVKRVLPEEVNVDVDHVIELLNEAVDNKAFPGAVLLASKSGKIFIQEPVGYHTYNKKRRMRESDIFDLASITKVISTTSAIMKLYDQGLIDLQKPVIDYLPAFKGNQSKHFIQKEKITIQNLLTHTSGLPPFEQYYLINGNSDSRLDSVYNTGPIYGISDTTVYSDVGIIVLGKVIESLTKVSLDEYTKKNIFEPLGMTTTMYNPSMEKMHRIVPTEINKDNILIRGYVHDENALSLGGVAGHAGLFSTAKDLATFSQMMLNDGIYGWRRIFKSETVNLFTEKTLLIKESSRCLGWDSPSGKSSGGLYLSDSSYGHTGFTGTSIWIDPENNIFVILLSNAVYPNRENKNPTYFDWRQRLHSSIYQALGYKVENSKLEWRKEW